MSGKFPPRIGALRALKRRQREWARVRGIAVDHNGYLLKTGENFFLPLSAGFVQALAAAGGGEIEPQRNRPPKLQSLYSSAALVVNVFQYWEARRGPVLPRALGFDGDLESLAIEQPLLTGLPGSSPTVDVALTLSGNRLLAIESKFSEWMTRKRPKLDAFGAKYLAGGRRLWADRGLPACQQLATDIAAGREAYRQLDALQLLKQALGLANRATASSALLYLYHDDSSGALGARHRAEVQAFAGRVDADLGFRALSYQLLLAALARSTEVDAAYPDWLLARYGDG